MWLAARCGLGAVVVAAAAIGGAPPAAADPSAPVSGDQSAEATINELQSQGYDVQINWVNGFDTKPLSECRVTGVNDPGHAAPTEGTFTTVYVDVACPNGDDGGGFSFGAGLG